VVTLPEHIGISNAGQVREELLSVINRGATTLIADMTATVSCDQAGAEAVIRAWQRAAASGTELRLVVTAQIVARVLRLVGLDRTVSVYPSLDAAAAARLPAAAGARAEGVPGRGSGDIAAAQQAHLRMLDAVITGLSQVGSACRPPWACPRIPPGSARRKPSTISLASSGRSALPCPLPATSQLRPAPPGGDRPKAGEPGGLAPGSPLSARMVMRADDRAGRIGTDVDRMLRIWHDDLAWVASCHPGRSGDRCRSRPR
jgi:anti-sigma B factor antagonist